MPKTVFDVLTESYQRQIEVLTGALARGSAKNYEEYKETCGSIRGLEYAIKEIEDLSRNYEDSIDE